MSAPLTMPLHTPHPWMSRRERSVGEMEHWSILGADGRKLVAVVSGHRHERDSSMPPVVEAATNVRVLTAAPALLARLELVVAYLAGVETVVGLDDAGKALLEGAKADLARARGGA